MNIGFKITKSLGEHTSEIALSYLTLTEKFREDAKLDASYVAQTYLLSLRLAIRAYSGLIKLKLNSRDRLERLNQLITNIASSGERARLWADLALYHYIYEQSDECKRIVDEYVRPLLKNISDTDKNYKDRIIVTVAPALYCTHQRTTVELVGTLPPYLKDDAYAQICKFILRKKPLSEPYDETLYDQGYKISYQEIIDLCDLLERMENDSKICFYIKSICDSIDSKYLKDRIAREQKSDIINRLNNLIDAKLPDLRNIQHEGYKIAAKAQLARLQKTSPQDWSNLCNSARNIGNIADQAFVLCIIAVAMPNKQREQRKQLLKEAKELVSKIPATLDRIGRYEDMVSMARTVEPMICKECLQLAIDEAFKNDSPEFYPVQRRIIDLAHMLDTDLSSSLASLADDDPARIRRHENLKHQSQMLDLKKKLANQTSEDFSSVHKGDLAKAAWRLLGDLNADRFQTFHLDYARKKLLYNTINLPFSESYPILALFIENAIQHPAPPEQASKYLLSLFEATILGTEIVQIMMARSVEHLKQAKNQAIQISEDKDSLIVRPGERDKAVQFIADWIEHEVKDYLTISDPYFGLEDLEILKLVLSRNPKCTVKILTSEMKQKKDNVSEPWKQAYRNYWKNISEPDPPFTDIFIIGTKTGKTPIHDRWWITDGGGLEIGTSFSGLGKKVSKITKLSQEEAKNEEKEIEQYLQRNVREHEGERLYYTTFTL